MDLTAAEGTAGCEEIKAYVKENAALWRLRSILPRLKRNLVLRNQSAAQPKTGNADQPPCPEDKERAIMAALEHFQIICGRK